MREWVVPEGLHVPVVAVDEEAITDHIGDIVEVLSPGRALVVAIDPPPERDLRLPIWAHPMSNVFFEPLQVWVSPSYTRYRQAYVRAKGHESVSGKVLAHVYNRRMATLRGYGFVRLIPVSRRANSSGGFSEQWGVELAAADLGARRRERGLRMQYADLSDLLVMLDISLGGGVQEVSRLGQNLIDVPGKGRRKYEAQLRHSAQAKLAQFRDRERVAKVIGDELRSLVHG
jgi:hypothetical protein